MNKGFTIIEIIISITIIAILAAIGITTFFSLKRNSDLNNATQEIANVLRLAQNKTIAYESSGRYGVYFDTTTSPQSYTLFKGGNYASREVLEDKVYFLPDTVEFQGIDFQGSNEIVFDRLTGYVDNWGSVSLAFKDDPGGSNDSFGGSNDVFVSGLGVVGFSQPVVADDAERVKDSRHVHIDYQRIIDTETEYIVLTSEESPVLQIAISQYLAGGQFDWEGTVDIGGQDQELSIHTHWLNDPSEYTQFCVHRDMRFNTAPIEMSVSGDGTGNFIEYSADGAATTSSSVYVFTPSGIEWQ